MKVEAVVEQGDTALGVAGPGVGRHQGGGRRRVLVPAPRRLRQGEQRTFQRIGEAAEGKLARQRQPGLELAERRRIKRSEEHTSELQSLMRISYAVFCLKKKKKTKEENYHTQKIHQRQKQRT